MFTSFVPAFDPYIALSYIPILPLLTAALHCIYIYIYIYGKLHIYIYMASCKAVIIAQ